MPKILVNSRINENTLEADIIRIDGYINQFLLTTSNVTFNSVNTNSLTAGSFNFTGSSFLLNATDIQFADNIILLNKNQTSPGVSLQYSGLEIERGSLENYRIVYDDLSGTLRAGLISDLLPLVFRENVPLNNGIMVWDNSLSRIKSVNQIDIDILFAGSNSTSTTTGAIKTSGGIGCLQDFNLGGSFYLRGTTNYFRTTNTNSVVNMDWNGTNQVVLTPNTSLDVKTTLIVSDTTNSTLVSNGSITTLGGLGVAKNINTDGKINCNDTTNATSYNSPGAALFVSGGATINLDLLAGGGVYTMSDSRLKKNIKKIDKNYLELIDKINIYEFEKMFIPDKKEIGFIAQDFLTDLPEMLSKTNDNYYKLDYISLLSLAFSCIKQLKQELKNINKQ